MPIKRWFAKIEGKITVEKDFIDMPKRHIVYMINRVIGDAFSYLKPHAQKNATKL